MNEIPKKQPTKNKIELGTSLTDSQQDEILKAILNNVPEVDNSDTEEIDEEIRLVQKMDIEEKVKPEIRLVTKLTGHTIDLEEK